jgi:hypothetical protein
MVNTYQLVNPQIEGKFKNKIKSQNSKEAANAFYKGLSEHFNNSVPTFYFTIQKGSSGSGKYFHFKVNEKRNDDEVKFTIKSVNLKNETEVLEKFRNRLDNFKAKQAGGKKKSKKSRKHKDSDDSSDSSDLDDSSESEYIYKRANKYSVTQPFNYWWYDPYLYGLNSVYIPTFYSYTTPYVELALILP